MTSRRSPTPLKHVSEWREGSLIERDVFLIPDDHVWAIEWRQRWEQHMAEPHAETIGLDANGERVVRDPSSGWRIELSVVGGMRATSPELLKRPWAHCAP